MQTNYYQLLKQNWHVEIMLMIYKIAMRLIISGFFWLPGIIGAVLIIEIMINGQEYAISGFIKILSIALNPDYFDVMIKVWVGASFLIFGISLVLEPIRSEAYYKCKAITSNPSKGQEN